MTLTEFLLARLAEDEAVAKDVPPPVYESDPFHYRFCSWESDHSSMDEAFVDRFNPARVLADIEAKRRIVEIVSPAWTNTGAVIPGSGLADVLRALAQPFADHPDYREEWPV